MFECSPVLIIIRFRRLLDRYKKHVTSLVVEWADCWHLVALADDRMRAEQRERIRRLIANEVDGSALAPPGWARNKPWSAVARRPIADAAHWNEQARYPAAAWVARGGRGAPLAPDERLPDTMLPGGRAASPPGRRGIRERAQSRAAPSAWHGRSPMAEARELQAAEHEQ